MAQTIYFINKISFLSSTNPMILHLSISFEILCFLGDRGHKNDDTFTGTQTSSGLGSETCPLRGDESRTLTCANSGTAFSPPKCAAQLATTHLISTVALKPTTPVSPSPQPHCRTSLPHSKDSGARNMCHCRTP